MKVGVTKPQMYKTLEPTSRRAFTRKYFSHDAVTPKLLSSFPVGSEPQNNELAATLQYSTAQYSTETVHRQNLTQRVHTASKSTSGKKRTKTGLRLHKAKSNQRPH